MWDETAKICLRGDRLRRWHLLHCCPANASLHPCGIINRHLFSHLVPIPLNHAGNVLPYAAIANARVEHEPAVPPTSALLRGCTLLYTANRSSLLDMALWTMTKVTLFNLISQFDTRPLQHPLKSSGLLSSTTSIQALTPHIYERREKKQGAVVAAIPIGNGMRRRVVRQWQSVAACGGVQRRAAGGGRRTMVNFSQKLDVMRNHAVEVSC
jgi:hypothetical protein